MITFEVTMVITEHTRGSISAQRSALAIARTSSRFGVVVYVATDVLRSHVESGHTERSGICNVMLYVYIVVVVADRGALDVDVVEHLSVCSVCSMVVSADAVLSTPRRWSQ